MSLLQDLIAEEVLVGENGDKAEAKLASIITEGYELWTGRYEESYGKSADKKSKSGLTKLWESSNPKDQKLAATTCLVMAMQEKWNKVQGCERLGDAMKLMGEATTMAGVGKLTPKILDVVRIFFPNQIAHLVADIQPLTQQNGEIFIIKPKYTNTAAGVVAGQEMFKVPSDGNYTSQQLSVALFTGNNSITTGGGSLVTPVRKGTVKVYRASTLVASDDSNGLITGSDTIEAGGPFAISGTVNYDTGALTVIFADAPTSGAIRADYLVDTESNTSQIREVEIALEMKPVRAEAHPVKVKWSVASELALRSHLNQDVPDILTNLAAQQVKMERDTLLIKTIDANATVDSNMNFDATASPYYPKIHKWQELELKLNYGESAIQTANGRGGISWILAGYNASDLFKVQRGFRDESPVAPIGAHKIGTLRDGTVDVIKTPTLGTNDYIIGYKGYMPGDAATILAEWIPMYYTPIFYSPELQASRGMMSMYDLFVNVATYFRKGTVSSYSA